MKNYFDALLDKGHTTIHYPFPRWMLQPACKGQIAKEILDGGENYNNLLSLIGIEKVKQLRNLMKEIQDMLRSPDEEWIQNLWDDFKTNEG